MKRQELIDELGRRSMLGIPATSENAEYAKAGRQFFQAVRAVVWLHKPVLNHHIHPMIEYCFQCQDGTPDEPYPCPTILAIEKELTNG